MYKGSDTRLDSIAWGALAALLAAAPWYRRLLDSPWAIAGFLALLLATMLIRDAMFRDVARYTLQGVALWGLVPALLARDRMLRRVLEAAPLVAIGRLSYSLYLWHWLALGVADWLWPQDRLLWLATGLGLSAGLAVASFAGIERPMLALRRRAGSHAPAGLLDGEAQPRARSPTKGFA